MSETVKGPASPEPAIGTLAQAIFMLLPDPARLYGRRAARLRRLATDSPMGEYLAFISTVVDAQQQSALACAAAQASPADEGHVAWCLDHRQPLFGRSDWRRDASWRAILDAILAAVARTAAPASAQAAMDALTTCGIEQREALADRLLRMTPAQADLAPAVFVNAALQVRWAQLAKSLPPERLVPIEPGWLCPVCGSRPVASLMDSPGATPRLRYLACSLCDSRWHYTRAVCADCGESRSVAYHEIEGVSGPARAETCDECESYVKFLQCDKDPDVDAFADDLASAGLDIMVQEAGWQRNAPNPFLLTG